MARSNKSKYSGELITHYGQRLNKRNYDVKKTYYSLSLASEHPTNGKVIELGRLHTSDKKIFISEKHALKYLNKLMNSDAYRTNTVTNVGFVVKHNPKKDSNEIVACVRKRGKYTVGVSKNCGALKTFKKIISR